MSKYSGKSDLFDLLTMHYKVIGEDKTVDLEKIGHWEIDAGGIRITGKEYRDFLPYFGNVAASSSHYMGEIEHHVVHLQPIPYFAERALDRANLAKELWKKARRRCLDEDKAIDTVVKQMNIDVSDQFWMPIFTQLMMSVRGNTTFSPYLLMKNSKYDIHYSEWHTEMLANGYTEHEIHGFLDADT